MHDCEQAVTRQIVGHHLLVWVADDGQLVRPALVLTEFRRLNIRVINKAAGRQVYRHIGTDDRDACSNS